MKRILTVLLTLLMVFTLMGCNSKQDTPIVEEPKQQEVVEEVKEEEPIVGGFIDVEDGTLTDELKEIFTKALEGLTGATYEPQELVATQVVAGTNYKFLANGKKITNPITIGKYYITIYQDLEGNVELKDIEVIEEKQEEVKEKDLTGIKFWVVTYDQYDNEISRTTAVYGSTVKDPNGKDVVVNTNKYFHTNVDYSSGSSSNNPPSTSPCSNTDALYYISKNDGTYTYYDSYNYNGGMFKGEKTYNNWETITLPVEVGKWYHSSNESTFVECEDPGHHKSNMIAKITIHNNKETTIALPNGGTLPSQDIYSKEYLPGTTYCVNNINNVITIGNDQYAIKSGNYYDLLIKGIVASGYEYKVNKGGTYSGTLNGNTDFYYSDPQPE